jgi:hypothetical protein
MPRPLPFLLALLVLPAAAGAQSRGCIERPVGPGMDVTVLVPLPQPPGSRGQPTPRAAVTVPNQPMYGTECIAVSPPPRDILRGEPPPPGGLLRGDDGRQDLLRDPTPARPPAWR